MKSALLFLLLTSAANAEPAQPTPEQQQAYNDALNQVLAQSATREVALRAELNLLRAQLKAANAPRTH